MGDMVDVFFCSAAEPDDDLRFGMMALCSARWDMEPEARISRINPTDLGCSLTGFQRMRRIFADTMACSETYVVADDDCMLPASFDILECVRIFEASGFSILSLMPSNCTISEWTPEQYITENTGDVMEHVSVGNIRFCKKGLMKKWPPMLPGYPGYDTIQSDQIRSEGGRVGYFRNHHAMHLGEGFSTIWGKETISK